MKKLCILLVGSLAAASIADARPDRLSRILVKQASDADAAAGTNDDVFPSVLQVANMIGTLGDGTVFLSGTGAPSNGTGADGDHYLDRTSGDVYLKAAGSWGAAVGNLRGPQGIQGVQGEVGPAGEAGSPGATGPAGADGQDGVDGINGVDGRTTWYTASGTPSDATGVDGDAMWRGSDGSLFVKVGGTWGSPVFSLSNVGTMHIDVLDLATPLAIAQVALYHSATADPTSGDDTAAGYVVGSRWINTSSDEEFVCTDASSGAANWASTTAAAGGGITDVVQDTTPQLGGDLDLNGHNLVAGATTISPTELGYLDGLAGAITTLLAAKAPLASPALTGTPTTPTAAPGTNNTQIASTAYVDAAVAAGGGGGSAHALLSATHTDTVAGTPVRGQTIVANSSNAWDVTALPKYAGSRLVYDGADTRFVEPTVFLWDEEFIRATSGEMQTNTSGTAAASTATAGEASHWGIWALSTGTDTTGSAGVRSATNSLLFGGLTVDFYAILKLPALNDGTDNFAVRVGTGDNTTGAHTDGVYFEYTSASANWQGITASNGTRTTASGGSNVAATTDWTILRASVNAAGTSASFYVWGGSSWTLIGTSTANIPTGTGRECGMLCHIVKASGTTARAMLLDKLRIFAR